MDYECMWSLNKWSITSESKQRGGSEEKLTGVINERNTESCGKEIGIDGSKVEGRLGGVGADSYADVEIKGGG